MYMYSQIRKVYTVQQDIPLGHCVTGSLNRRGVYMYLLFLPLSVRKRELFSLHMYIAYDLEIVYTYVHVRVRTLYVHRLYIIQGADDGH